MKPGQRVVCIETGNWKNRITLTPVKDENPIKGLIYTVALLHTGNNGKLYLVFEELNPFNAYLSKHFIPLDENWTEEVITKALQQQLTKKELV